MIRNSSFLNCAFLPISARELSGGSVRELDGWLLINMYYEISCIPGYYCIEFF